MITDTIYRSLISVPRLQRLFKRIVLKLPSRKRMVSHFNQRFYLDPSELSGFYLYYEHEYDDYVFKFLSSQVLKYRRALDLGANIGIYTAFFAARTEHVDAFEPEPSVLPLLRENLQLNGLTNVVIHETCVGNVTGTVNFISPDKHNRGIGRIVDKNEQGVQRSCIRLDDFLGESLQGPCIIKMDIEGGEWLALQGAQQILIHRKAPVSILLEVHPEEICQLGGSVELLKKLLEKANLKVKGLTPTGLQPIDSEKSYRFWWATSEDY